MRVTPPVLRALTLATLLASLVVMSGPTTVHAGCGCQKLPPPPASVRPAATYAGTSVTLFHSALVNGQAYTVRFTSGTTGQSATVSALALTRRDLGDGQYKPQLAVPVPNLPLGPTSITVSQVGQSGALLAVSDDTFTIAPAPIVVPSQVGEYRYQDYRAAVSRGGVVYISLDLRNITLPMTFQAQPKGYPLRFGSKDVVFYNTQGFLMQLLDQNMSGLFAITAANTAVDGDMLQYARHEFNTFFLQHEERTTHAVDPMDPNWHLDGTRHIDHNLLIVALRDTPANGQFLAPGTTPGFELAFNTYSFFRHGLVGIDGVSMSGTTRTDSYHSKTGLSGLQGDVLSNGTVSMGTSTTIAGDATAAQFSLGGNAQITGAKIVTSQPTRFLPVSIPNGLQDLGNLKVSGTTRTLVGPASFRAADITLSNQGQLFIDNSQGPVTLYVTGPVQLTGGGTIVTADPNPEKFAIYVGGKGKKDVALSSQGASFYGVIYAPESKVTLSGNTDFYGAFVGATISMSGDVRVHYDTALRGQ